MASTPGGTPISQGFKHVHAIAQGYEEQSGQSVSGAKPPEAIFDLCTLAGIVLT